MSFPPSIVSCPEVTEPVRMHVAAKRYLCATNPSYFGKLSPASVETLKLQGGPMKADEVAAFEGNPFFQQNGLLFLSTEEVKENTEKLAKGEPVAPDAYYFRTAAVFSVRAGPHDWLRRKVRDPLVAELRQGATPEAVSAAVCVSFAIAIVPRTFVLPGSFTTAGNCVTSPSENALLPRIG